MGNEGGDAECEGEVGEVGANDVAGGEVDGVSLGGGDATDDHFRKRCSEANDESADDYRRNAKLFGHVFGGVDSSVGSNSQNDDAAKHSKNGKNHPLKLTRRPPTPSHNDPTDGPNATHPDLTGRPVGGSGCRVRLPVDELSELVGLLGGQGVMCASQLGSG